MTRTTTRTRALAATTVVTLALAVGGAGTALAQSEPTPEPSAPAASAPSADQPRVAASGERADRIRARLGKVGTLVAETIGIDRATLRTELKAGKTIAEIATANDVDPQAVVDALVEAANARIDRALEAGRITEERAAALREKAPTAVSKLVNGELRRR